MTTALSNSSYNNNHSAGFTLIELMVTIAVLAIIVSIAAPNVSTQLANQRVKATTATLVSALKEAKAESVIRRQALEFSFDANNHSIAIKTKEDSPVEVASYSYSSKSIVKADETSITFSPSKRADAVTLNVCDNYSATTMQVIVTTAANISSAAGGTCS